MHTPHNAWADEGFEIVKAFIYEQIQENVEPSESYLNNGKELAEK